VAAEKLITFDATLGINPIFFAVEFFDEFAAEYCFTPVAPANRVSASAGALETSSFRRFERTALRFCF
jgi:hypothetical protein